MDSLPSESEKDSRGRNRIEQREKMHHKDHAIIGPDFIQKRLYNAEANSNSEDPFGVQEAEVPYSLNKSGRWTMVEASEARERMQEADAGTSFVSVSAPRFGAHYLVPGMGCGLDPDSINVHRGAVKFYIEKDEEEEVTERRGRAGRTTLDSLQGSPDPGPFSRRERRMEKEEERKGHADATEEHPAPHLSYTTFSLLNNSPDYAKSQLRKRQTYTRNWGSATNQRPHEDIAEQLAEMDMEDEEEEMDEDSFRPLSLAPSVSLPARVSTARQPREMKTRKKKKTTKKEEKENDEQRYSDYSEPV